MSGDSLSSSSSAVSRPNSSSFAQPDGQENVLPQRGLQDASVALEVAYNRIRQVRRDLLQFSEPTPSEGRTLRPVMDHDEIRPGHEALLLSGGEYEEQSEPEGRPARTSHFRSMPLPPTRQAGDPDDPMLPPLPALPMADIPSERSTTTQLPTSRNTDGATRPPRLRTRRERSPNDVLFFARDASNPDSASTTRGLRVAARESHGQHSGGGPQAHAAEFDFLLARQRERMAESANALAALRTQRTERQNRPQRTSENQDTSRTTLSNLPPSRIMASTTAFRSPDPRRWQRRIRPDSHPPHPRQISPDPAYEIDMLWNIPNRPPSSGNGSRRPWWTSFGPTRSVDANLEMSIPDDMSSNINIDWSDDDFISWLFPTQDVNTLPPIRDLSTRRQTDRPANADTIRITRTTDTTVSPPENLPPRRGWARLDPDGNEIPPSEEEELERSRTEYRLRALQQNRQAGSSGTLFHATAPRNLYGSVLDSTIRVPEGRQRFTAPHSSDSTPLYVNPLPMPLDAMVKDSEIPQHSGIGVDVIIPQYACLAGR